MSHSTVKPTKAESERVEAMQSEVSVLWADIPGFDGKYEVSSNGEVKSLDRRDAAGNAIKGRILKPRAHTGGYLRVQLSNRKSQDYFIHRLVLLAFVGQCPEGHEGCHGNGDKTDNRLENLRWDSREGNCRDRKLHGVQPMGETHWTRRNRKAVNRGENHQTSKLSQGDVDRIYDFLAVGCTHASIAEWIGVVKRESIGTIARGITWRTHESL